MFIPPNDDQSSTTCPSNAWELEQCWDTELDLAFHRCSDGQTQDDDRNLQDWIWLQILWLLVPKPT